MLTGQADGYYADYIDAPMDKLVRALSEGFVFQGEPMKARGGRERGQPSAHLAPQRFIAFMQNHDQIGNRPAGDRLSTQVDPVALRAAHALLLLCPQIPMLFMGEEWGSKQPFQFFTDFGGDLGQAVRDGRRREFSGFTGFTASDLAEQIPATSFWCPCCDPIGRRKSIVAGSPSEASRFAGLLNRALNGRCWRNSTKDMPKASSDLPVIWSGAVLLPTPAGSVGASWGGGRWRRSACRCECRPATTLRVKIEVQHAFPCCYISYSVARRC